MHAIQTGISPAMQAVDMVVVIDGQPVRALIPRAVFEQCLHTPATPDAWLRCCEEQADVLEAAIRRRYAAKPQDQVVVRCSDFGVLAPGPDEAES